MQEQTARILQVVKARTGFIEHEHELPALANDPDTRMMPVLVRCNGGRFVTPAANAEHFIMTVTREGRDDVRDVSLVEGYQYGA